MKSEKENQNENLKKKENLDIKLNYDYHFYENLIINNPKTKPINLQPKKDSKVIINKNILNNINQNDIQKKSLTEMVSNKNTEVNINSKNGLYQDFIYDTNNNNETTNYDNSKRYIQTTRKNIKHSSKILNNNMKIIEKDNLKQKDPYENKLNINDLLIDSNEKKYYDTNFNKKRKKKEETKEFQSLELLNKKNKNLSRMKNSNAMINKLHEEYLLTNEDLDFDNDKDINYYKKDIKNLKSYRSNPQLITPVDTDTFDISEEKNENKKKNKKISNLVIQDKFDLLYKDHFILKTKYEMLKTNMNILQKKLKQKNYDISQMKKVLLSNKQQINFLSTLKDSNLKTLKDNEDLITNLKNAITNLNSKIIDYKNKLSLLNNNNYNALKSENESLKIYLNDRDKTITTLKNSLSFLTQNLDNILNNSNNNEANEKIIIECEQKIKTLKEQMNQKLYEFNIEKNQNLEDKFYKIKKENENITKILEQKNFEIEKYTINIKELNENISNKNKEIIEIKNEFEKIKKNLEDKEKELEEKNVKIKELNNDIEKKNIEINDLKKTLDMKNLEIEERKKKNDFQIMNQSSLEFYRQVKKYEVDIKNKKNYLTQNNFIKIDDINNSNDNNSFSINSNKLNSENNYEKSNNNSNNKFFIKKIKSPNLDLKNKNHLNKDLLFNNKGSYSNKFRIKTNFDYFNNENNYEKERGKTMRSLYNFNYRKYKSNKNFNTIIGNNLLFNQTSNTNMNNTNKDSFINRPNTLKLHLFNDNDEDIKKVKNRKINNKQSKHSTNLVLSTSTISVSQNENIKSMSYPEKSAFNYEYIYSLINSDLICFNLKERKFDIIKINDNTKGIFSSYISYYKQNRLQPLLLNTSKYFYIVMQKYIFYYDFSLNSIDILAKTFSNHLNGKFIKIENNLYLISGNNNTHCELYSLIINQNKSLPSTNYPRINSGICNVNNEYIYIFFGQFCENSIERLNIKNLNFDKKWETIKIKEINGINKNSFIYLEKFMTFLDDYNNIIIFGGQDYNNEKCNKSIFGFNLNDNSFSTIGKIDSCALYGNQYIKLDESIFSVFDENNGLHFFSKELDYHEIFNLNL